MGYWATTPQGQSFALDSDMLWGDSPADILDDAVSQIAKRTKEHAGTPSKEWLEASFEVSLNNFRDDFDNIEEVLSSNTDGTIFNKAIATVVKVFREDVGRAPSKDELRAGLRFTLGVYPEQEQHE